MKDLFTTILIPVDFSINTEVAIEKALALAKKGTTIHLLHIQGSLSYGMPIRSLNYLNGEGSNTYYKEAEQQLKHWKNCIEENSLGIHVVTWILLHTKIQQAIEKMAEKLHPGLIVIGKSSNHSWFPFLNTIVPNKIVQHTGIAVLTLKPGAVHNGIRTVVVPVSKTSSGDKRQILSAFCSKFKLKIHLVRFDEEGSSSSRFDTSSLLEMYQWLKTAHHVPVDYAVLQGKNRARAILEYAERIDADMLLVHPESETRIGWPDKHISDVLPARSKVQVLAVQPNPIL